MQIGTSGKGMKRSSLFIRRSKVKVTSSCVAFAAEIISRFKWFYRAMLLIARPMPSQDVCLSARPSVCLSHADILLKRLYVSSNFLQLGVTTPF